MKAISLIGAALSLACISAAEPASNYQTYHGFRVAGDPACCISQPSEAASTDTTSSTAVPTPTRQPRFSRISWTGSQRLRLFGKKAAILIS